MDLWEDWWNIVGASRISPKWVLSLFFQGISEDSPLVGKKKEQNLLERKDWPEKIPTSQPKERDLEKEEERKQSKEKAAQIKNQGEDFERTPSGRVRRQSAQVAVFHLQEIAEDELAKDWGTKRRIKDDLVPDSKRVRRHYIQCWLEYSYW